MLRILSQLGRKTLFLWVLLQIVPCANAQSPTILTYITASDKNGAPVVLDPSGLSVLIDKKPARLVAARPAKDEKLLFAVLLDVSTSVLENTQAADLKKATADLFGALSHGENQGYLVAFNARVGMSKGPLQMAEVEPSLERLQFSSGTALYDAIDETCNIVLSRSRNADVPRRAIFLISDGGDNSSHSTRDAALLSAQREGVAIFSLQPGFKRDRESYALKSLSNATGGKRAAAKNVLDAVTDSVADAGNQWVLELAPNQPFDQKLHTFEFSTTQKGVMLSSAAKILLP